MAVSKVQIGQVWKKKDSGDNYLVTKLYTEALATYAVLRRTGAETEDRVRVKVEKAADGQQLPGFSFAQESD